MTDYNLDALAEAAQDSKRGDLRTLLDRAYSLGFTAAWDGSLEFDTPITLGDGVQVQHVIDPQNALDAEGAFRNGHITEKQYADAMNDTSDALSADVGTLSQVSCSSSDVTYVWAYGGSLSACFSTGATWVSTHPASQPHFDEVSLRNVASDGWMRAQSRYRNSAGGWNYTDIRTASSLSYVSGFMGSPVPGLRAEVWYSRFHNWAPNPYA